MEIVRDFIAFRKLIKAIKKIELEENEKVSVQNFDRWIIDKIGQQVLANLWNEMINWEITPEYIRGFKHWVWIYLSYFRKYFKN